MMALINITQDVEKVISGGVINSVDRKGKISYGFQSNKKTH